MEMIYPEENNQPKEQIFIWDLSHKNHRVSADLDKVLKTERKNRQE